LDFFKKKKYLLTLDEFGRIFDFNDKLSHGLDVLLVVAVREQFFAQLLSFFEPVVGSQFTFFKRFLTVG